MTKAAKKTPHILLTNDDGFHAPGIAALAAALRPWAKLSIVAPNREQSGAAQSLTLRNPIVCHERGENHWAIEGTPADCVIVALHKLLPEPPDLLLSGINHGANLGENAYYSGTVGAAREGALHHVPSCALSLCSKHPAADFAAAARIARNIAELILREPMPDQVLLNVNVPEKWEGEVLFTRQSKKITRNHLQEGRDPKGRTYYWLSEQKIDKDAEKDTDYAAIFSKAVSITPLHLDPTHTQSLNHLSHWAQPLQSAFER